MEMILIKCRAQCETAVTSVSQSHVEMLKVGEGKGQEVIAKLKAKYPKRHVSVIKCDQFG